MDKKKPYITNQSYNPPFIKGDFSNSTHWFAGLVENPP